jgi:serine/threonine-protein kinase
MPRSRAPQDWPVPDERLRPSAAESETLVGVGGPPPGARRWYDDHLAAGLLSLLVLLLVVAGAAYYFHHRHHHAAAPAQTVVVTTVAKPKTPHATAMPPLVGLTQQAAAARLQRMHVSATVVQRPSSRARGTVVSQQPAQASALTAQTPVTLVVSTGVTKIAVPNLVGQPAAKARASLGALGLRAATTSVTMAGKPAGTVVDQAPKPGKKIAKSGLVTLSVVKAPGGKTTATVTTATTATTSAAPAQPQTATVPDVSGQDEAAAVQALAQAGILPSLVFVSSSDPLGTVEAQAKPQGATVPYRSHLQINISSGQNPTPEQVPNVVGSTLQQALARMNGAHLRMIYVNLAVPRSQAGKVAQQTPLPGSGAPQGAQVLVLLGVYR